MEWKAKYPHTHPPLPPVLSLLPPFDVATSPLLISYPICLLCFIDCVCMCVLFSTGEPGAEAFLDVLFEELASRQKSGKALEGKRQLVWRFVLWSTCSIT